MPANFTTTIWTNERIYTVDFARAKTGTPHRRFPDVDNAGYSDTANASEHGPITSAMVGQTRVTVLFKRTEISTAAKLFAVSTDPSVVQISSPIAAGQLGATTTQNIQFSALAAGRAAIEIRYNWADGPVLGRLYVQVYARNPVPMLVHILKINGRGQQPTFFSQACANRAQQVAHFTSFVNKANETWVPHGIVFTTTFIDTTWGVTQVPSGNQQPSKQEMMTAGMNSPNRSGTAVNVFLVPGVGPDAAGNAANITGMGISSAMAKAMGLRSPAVAPPPPAVQHLGSGLYLDSTSTATSTTVAHEMGHYMSLCALPNLGHSTGDIAGNQATRDDLISRRRLMYPVVGLEDAAPDNWRNDTGYGDKVKGSFVTYRNLPNAQDISFGESLRARTAAVAPGFYAP